MQSYVVDFAIVDEPEMRVGSKVHWLHPIRWINDGQTLKTETGIV